MENPDSRLSEYQTLLSAHYHDSPYRRPDSFEGPNVFGETPTCGDEVRLWTSAASKNGQRLESLFIEAEGCIISQAGASLMCRYLLDNTDGGFAEVLKVSRQFQEWIVDGVWPPEFVGSELESLRSTRNYPLRHRCLRLPWTTLDLLILRLSSPE